MTNSIHVIHLISMDKIDKRGGGSKNRILGNYQSLFLLKYLQFILRENKRGKQTKNVYKMIRILFVLRAFSVRVKIWHKILRFLFFL